MMLSQSFFYLRDGFKQTYPSACGQGRVPVELMNFNVFGGVRNYNLRFSLWQAEIFCVNLVKIVNLGYQSCFVVHRLWFKWHLTLTLCLRFCSGSKHKESNTDFDHLNAGQQMVEMFDNTRVTDPAARPQWAVAKLDWSPCFDSTF